MKILVTGADGYIGTHVVKHLLDKGHYVIACDKHNNNIDNRANFVQYDIFQYDILTNTNDNLYEFFEKPDVCLHLAHHNTYDHNNENHIKEIDKHFIFLTKLIEQGVKHIVCAGTIHEIGICNGKIDEYIKCEPINLYGIAKNKLKNKLLDYQNKHDFTFKWIRFFYVCGDDIHSHSIFTKLLNSNNESIPFISGEQCYDYIDVDVLSCYVEKIITQTKINGIINCCSGKPKSIKSKVEEFLVEHNLNVTLRYGEYKQPKIFFVYGDVKKLNNILNNKN